MTIVNLSLLWSIDPNQCTIQRGKNTTTHIWCDDHSICISVCGVWGDKGRNSRF